jgi:hypothetical protein
VQLRISLISVLLVLASACLQLRDGRGGLLGPVGTTVVLVLAAVAALVAARQLSVRRDQAGRCRTSRR